MSKVSNKIREYIGRRVYFKALNAMVLLGYVVHVKRDSVTYHMNEKSCSICCDIRRTCQGCGLISFKPLDDPLPIVLPCSYAWSMANHCDDNYCKACWYNHMEVEKDE